MEHARSALSPYHLLSERWSGISQMLFLQQVAAVVGTVEGVAQVARTLKEIGDRVVASNGLKLSLNAEGHILEASMPHMRSFAEELPDSPALSPATPLASLSMTSSAPPPTKLQTGDRVFFCMPGMVNYNAWSLPGVPMVHPDFVPLQVSPPPTSVELNR
jgi:Zn-dependent M16 (insulinase) family peptidase